jgi:DNA-binding response OmpR family regulator
MTDSVSVLHVEDDPLVRDLVAARFAQVDDVDATLASTPEEGLSMLAAHDFDCLVSDSLTLPSGEPFVLAARERHRTLPIVLYTAKAWEEVESVADAAAVSDHVQKNGGGDFDQVLAGIRTFARSEDGDEFVAVLQSEDDAPSTFDGSERTHPEWTRIGDHDWEADDELGLSIVEAVERFVGPDSVDRDLLFDNVDPDALELVLDPAGRDARRSNVQVRLPFAGCEVALRDDGAIAARQLDDD